MIKLFQNEAGEIAKAEATEARISRQSNCDRFASFRCIQDQQNQPNKDAFQQNSQGYGNVGLLHF